MATHNILPSTTNTVPIADLTPHPDNARQGNTDLIAQSLEHNGQYRLLVVQRSTGHVLAGNHTLAAAQQLDWTQVAVTFIDVDDTTARKILLADKKTSDEATYDEADDLILALSEPDPARDPFASAPGATPETPDAR